MKTRWLCGILALVLFAGLLSGLPMDTKAAETMSVSDDLIEVLKKMEGFYAYPYWDYAQWTIGYGTRCPDDKLEEYKQTGITEEIAMEMLYEELATFEKTVNNFAAKYDLDLLQHQFDALVSFSYNCGGAWTRDVNGFFNVAVRTGQVGNALIYGMTLYSTAGGDYILVKRRLTEANMYLNGEYKAYNYDSDRYPSTYKYVFLDGNGATATYAIHAYDAADPIAPMTHFSSIPTGVDEEGNSFVYELVGWFTEKTGGTQVELLDGSLPNGTVLYAQWRAPGSEEIATFPKGTAIEPLEITTTSEINLREGPGTFYPKAGAISKNTVVTVTETFLRGKYLWGKIEDGWISLSYTNYEDALAAREEAQKNQLPRPGVVTGNNVNVRNGPSTKYDVQYQLSKGDAVVISEIYDGGTLQWGKLEDGNWICLTYVEWVEVEEETEPTEPAPTVTGLTLLQEPWDKEYVQMQELIHPNGSVLQVHYSDGTSQAMSLTRAMITDYDNSQLGETTVTATYEGYTVSFNVNIIMATIDFVHEDGTLISSAQYAYGDTVVVPEDPVKAEDEAGEYIFLGWDREVTTCNGSRTYKAVFELYVEKFPVTFLNYDGTVLSTGEYALGETVPEPETPTRPSDELGEYVFVGWDKELVPCEGETVYTAVYELHVWKYPVTFLDYDGTVLSTAEYAKGDTVIQPEAPTRPSDELGEYEFVGWDKEVVACDGEAVYTAVYELHVWKYAVTFLNYDGTVLSTAEYAKGDTVVQPETPVRPADVYGDYEFVGWDKEVVICDGEAVYTAVYELHLAYYTVTFQDHDGRVLSTLQYTYGETVTIPEAPTRAADAYGSYVFDGWDKEVTVCQADVVYTAVYLLTPNMHTITFKNYDGSVITKVQFAYGAEVIAPEVPARPADAYGTYVFAGWHKKLTVCTGNQTYIAIFEMEPQTGTWPQNGIMTGDQVNVRTGPGTIYEKAEYKLPLHSSVVISEVVYDGTSYWWGKLPDGNWVCMRYVLLQKVIVPGDIDCNGKVNSDDVVQLLLHISLPDMFPLTVDADFTGDGKVTSDDVVQLLLHISLPDVFPLEVTKKAALSV